MDITNSIIYISGGLFAGIVLGYIIVSYSLKSKHKSQIKKAALEAENIKKDKIIQAKEKFLELKEKHEQIIATRERKMQEKEILKLFQFYRGILKKKLLREKKII